MGDLFFIYKGPLDEAPFAYSGMLEIMDVIGDTTKIKRGNYPHL